MLLGAAAAACRHADAAMALIFYLMPPPPSSMLPAHYFFRQRRAASLCFAAFLLPALMLSAARRLLKLPMLMRCYFAMLMAARFSLLRRSVTLQRCSPLLLLMLCYAAGVCRRTPIRQALPRRLITMRALLRSFAAMPVIFAPAAAAAAADADADFTLPDAAFFAEPRHEYKAYAAADTAPFRRYYDDAAAAERYFAAVTWFRLPPRCC